jgi:hypothetical protein
MFLAGPVWAATNPQIAARPQARVVQNVDVTKVVTITRSHAALVDHLQALGRLPSATPMGHLMLVLRSTDEQEFALQRLLDEQQDKSSANYHQWMTPDTFGQTFGAHPADPILPI